MLKFLHGLKMPRGSKFVQSLGAQVQLWRVKLPVFFFKMAGACIMTQQSLQSRRLAGGSYGGMKLHASPKYTAASSVCSEEVLRKLLWGFILSFKKIKKKIPAALAAF